MKTTYAIILILFFGETVCCMTSCKNNSKATEQISSEKQDTTAPKKVDPGNNPYNDLRNMALGATAKQIGVQFSTDQTKIYGIIMDWDLGEGTATLVSFLSGDASVYLSSGGGFIGAGQHDNVKKAGIALINKAEKYLNKSTKTEVAPLPEKDGVLFYFLTNKGKFVGKENIKNLENHSSGWSDLFDEANKLISEIRIISASKSK